MDFKITLAGPSGKEAEYDKFPGFTATYIDTFQSPTIPDCFVCVIGGDNGSVIVWHWRSGDQIKPFMASIFHRSAITLVSASNRVTADQSGKVALWDESYGRVQGNTELPARVNAVTEFGEHFYFCGQFSEIIVLDKRKLALYKRLSSRLYPDWICSVAHIGSQVIGITVTGILKVWFAGDLEPTESSAEFAPHDSRGRRDSSVRRNSAVQGPILEDEVRRLTGETPVAVLLSQKFLVIISPLCVEVYRLGDFTKLFEMRPETGSDTVYCGGQFIRPKVLACWTILGSLTIYELLEEKGGFRELKKIALAEPIQGPNVVNFLTGNCFIHGIRTNRLAINGGRKDHGGYFVDHSATARLQAACFVECVGKVAVCYDDGRCYMEEIGGSGRESLVLHPNETCTTAIMHPHTFHPHRYEEKVVVAGCFRGYVAISTLGMEVPQDMPERTNNKATWYTSDYTRLPVHMAAVQAFHIPPNGVSRYLESSVVSISKDNSICLINLIDKRVILRCNHFTKPIKIFWKPKEDYMIVQEYNKSISVWECEARRLERKEPFGSVSEMILAAARGSKGVGTDPSVNCGNIDKKLAASSDGPGHNVAKGNVALRKVLNGWIFSVAWEKLLQISETRQRVQSPTFQISGNDTLKSTVMVKNLAEWAKKEMRGENEHGRYQKDQADVAMSPEPMGPRCSMDGADGDVLILAVLGRALDLGEPAISRFGVLSDGKVTGVFFGQYPDKRDHFTSSYITTEYLTALLAINAFFTGNQVPADSPEDLLPKDGSSPPLLDILAKYWCHPCSSLRGAVKHLLVMELRRMGTDGRAILLDLCKQSNTTILTAILVEWFHEEFSSPEMCATIRDVGLDLLNIIDAREDIGRVESSIELLGTGFLVYQPYFEFSKVMHSLFQITIDENHPSLSQPAFRALLSICKLAAMPFVMTVSTEITRLSVVPTLADNEYSLLKVKLQILKCLDFLLENQTMVRFLQQVVEIVLFALDLGALKEKSLKAAFPKLEQYNQVSSFQSRVAVGCTNGNLLIYETSRFAGAGQKFAQILQSQMNARTAHGQPISATAFSPSGRMLACYSPKELKISFWSVEASSILGGLSLAANSLMRKGSGTQNFSGPQLRLRQVHSVIPTQEQSVDELPRTKSKDSLQKERIVWVNDKTAVLYSLDGSEFRFMV